MVGEPVSGFVSKGEVPARYYNPGNLFREVHLVLTNDDRPDPADVQPMAGEAELHIHNLPLDRHALLRAGGWRPRLLEPWARRAVDIARDIAPDVVRAPGADLNAFAGLAVKRALGTPLVVSVHTIPGDDAGADAWTLRHRAGLVLRRSVERLVLREADLVVAVYRSLLPYLARMGARNVELIYNAIGVHAYKTDYALHDPVELLCVGRQIHGKDPTNIIRAAARISGARLTLIGDGSMHDALVALARDLDIADRVVFRRSVPNRELCAELPRYDLAVVHDAYRGIAKAVMEPMLAGLPLISNQREVDRIPELDESGAVLVRDDDRDYERAIRAAIADPEPARRAHGEGLREWARQTFDPAVMEQRAVDSYRRLLAARA